ncbi:MAG: HDOD domain-containing protein [Deferrisomatales bacterium]|nr:HDOD domain-containing protein [Deferrisomatales bacterium]
MAPSTAEQLSATFRRDPALPSLPESVSRVLALVRDEEVHFRELAAEVQKNPAMTLAVLRLANSAAYAAPQEVNNLQRAFAVIGLRQIPSLLAGFASVGRCENFLKDPAFHWDEFWRHCSGTAFIAVSLARRLGLQRGGGEFLAGLLHDIGYLGLAKFDPRAFGDCVEECQQRGKFLPDILKARFGVGEPEAGALLAEASNLDSHILASIRHKPDPAAAPPEERTLVATVALASQLAHLIGLTFCRGAADVELLLEQHPAWQVLRQRFPQMDQWDVARLVFELEREYATSEVFVNEARRSGCAS